MGIDGQAVGLAILMRKPAQYPWLMYRDTRTLKSGTGVQRRSIIIQQLPFRFLAAYRGNQGINSEYVTCSLGYCLEDAVVANVKNLKGFLMKLQGIEFACTMYRFH
jgi:hypothetical protein